MRASKAVLFLALVLPALAAQAQTAQPGELVPPFGDGDGIKRIDFNDLTGGTVDLRNRSSWSAGLPVRSTRF